MEEAIAVATLMMMPTKVATTGMRGMHKIIRLRDNNTIDRKSRERTTREVNATKRAVSTSPRLRNSTRSAKEVTRNKLVKRVLVLQRRATGLSWDLRQALTQLQAATSPLRITRKRERKNLRTCFHSSSDFNQLKSIYVHIQSKRGWE